MALDGRRRTFLAVAAAVALASLVYALVLRNLYFGQQAVTAIDDIGEAAAAALASGACAWAASRAAGKDRLGWALIGISAGLWAAGEVVWSRVFIMDARLHVDLGRATALDLPQEETQRRLDATTPQWPIMHAVTYGVSRDQMMARHKANHIQVVYAPGAKEADHAMAVKAATFRNLGMDVSICGTSGL